MAQSGSSAGHDGSSGTRIIARAHHGSVSKEQRAQIEADLKSGQLPCVVATSSLELGIDMGAVDIVVQVEAPPSVASGLQRVGRAGHQVGATSRGVFFPNHRGDLIESAVVVERMRLGAIEEVASCATPWTCWPSRSSPWWPRPRSAAGGTPTEIKADDVYALVRRADGFRDLPHSAFEAMLDMLSGRYPSEDFAELRPRIVWQRDTGLLTGRPGAQRLAVTSGGTIPDRGLFGVFLVGEGTASGRHNPGRRVGELDEEMVYETRVGDVFTLGTTSWRVEQITHDQVLVSPAPGVPGRLPFWKGDSPPRPLELGRAFGAFVREIGDPRPRRGQRPAARGRARRVRGPEPGQSYLAEQHEATAALPTDTTVVVERFRDELGDWRVCRALPARFRSAHAVGAGHRAGRSRPVRDGGAGHRHQRRHRAAESPTPSPSRPERDLVIVDPEQLEAIVTEEVGGSALFAARFRECAARALLLPRRDPKSRSPLWQQRMRSAQLLTVAAQYPEFPIVLETMRECLTDVFDLDGLIEVQRQLAARTIRLVEVETREPSPFAKSLLFGYVGAFVYEGDVPLAEKKAAALSLDAGLLAELLGKDGLRQLLDPEVIAATEADLQGLSEQRRATTAEQLFDLLRTAGPFTPAELQRSGGRSRPRCRPGRPGRRPPRGPAPDRRPGDGRRRRGRAPAAGRTRHAGAAGSGRRVRVRHQQPPDRGSGAALGPHPRTVRHRRDRRAVRPRAGGRRGGLRRDWSGPAPWSAAPSSTPPPGTPDVDAVLPHPGARPDQAPLAGRPAPRGRAGRAGGVRAVPGRVAGGRARARGAPTRCCPPSSSSPGTRCRPARWSR